MADEKKPSKIEKIKIDSRYLHGSVVEEIENDSDHFESDTTQVLKHHGTYQQDDRDVRSAKKGKKFGLMVRTRIPGGQLTSQQMLAELDMGDDLGTGSLRITSRQGLQLHGIPKADLKETIQRIYQEDLSTLGACGDVNRNVMCCPGAYHKPMYAELHALSREIAERFSPRTPAYREIWLRDLETGEKESVPNPNKPEEVEPLYGKTYLPRKFKVGIALPDDNCIDVYTHDIGLLGIAEDDQIVGYNVLVGGGMGTTPSNKKTFPALGKKMAFVEPQQAAKVAEAILKVQRDNGNRSDRKTARLKYLINNIGLEAFRSKVEAVLGTTLQPPREDDVREVNDHIGWEEQGDGRWCYGLNIENGRLVDTDTCKLKSAVRQICRQLSPPLRLTAHQSLLFIDLADEDRATVEQILRDHDVPLSEQISTVRRWSMACVAFPTCGLAITESERVLPSILDEMEAALAKWGLSSEAFTVRMTGCPNGCARPYNADIGLVGKAKNRYTMFVGGSRLGHRLNFIYKDLVPRDQLVTTLNPLFAFFKQARENGETFGDFCHRQGVEKLGAWADQFT